MVKEFKALPLLRITPEMIRNVATLKFCAAFKMFFPNIPAKIAQNV